MRKTQRDEDPYAMSLNTYNQKILDLGLLTTNTFQTPVLFFPAIYPEFLHANVNLTRREIPTPQLHAHYMQEITSVYRRIMQK